MRSIKRIATLKFNSPNQIVIKQIRDMNIEQGIHENVFVYFVLKSLFDVILSTELKLSHCVDASKLQASSNSVSLFRHSTNVMKPLTEKRNRELMSLPIIFISLVHTKNICFDWLFIPTCNFNCESFQRACDWNRCTLPIMMMDNNFKLSVIPNSHHSIPFRYLHILFKSRHMHQIRKNNKVRANICFKRSYRWTLLVKLI